MRKNIFLALLFLFVLVACDQNSGNFTKSETEFETPGGSLTEVTPPKEEPPLPKEEPAPPPEVDSDNDSVPDSWDNCTNTPNPDQADTDENGIGDACEPVVPPPDADSDGLDDAHDNCPEAANVDQADLDGDGFGDACDSCQNPPKVANNDKANLRTQISPEPKVISSQANTMQLDANWKIFVKKGDPKLLDIAQMLKKDIVASKLLLLEIVQYSDAKEIPSERAIVLEVENNDGFLTEYLLKKQIGLNAHLGCKADGKRLGHNEGHVVYINEIIGFLGETHAALHDSIQTFWWLMRGASGKNFKTATIVDWPDYYWRGLYLPHYAKPRVNEMLYRLKLNRVYSYLNYGQVYGLADPNNAFRKAYIEREGHFIKFMPEPGLEAIFDIPSTSAALAEGWHVADEVFKFNQGSNIAVPDTPKTITVDISIAKMKDEDLRSGFDIEWEDNTVLCKTSPCLKVSASMNANAKSFSTKNVYYNVGSDIPSGVYILSGWVKNILPESEDIKCTLNAVVANTGQKYVSHYYENITRKFKQNEWRQFFATFNVPPASLDNTKLRFYFQVVANLKDKDCQEGSYVIDDVKIDRLNSALRNVIITKDTKVVVKSPDGKKTYVENVDYKLVGAETPLPSAAASRNPVPCNTSYMCNPLGGSQVRIEWLLPKSKPAKIKVSYDFAAFNKELGQPYFFASMSEENVYDIWEKQLIKPLFTNIGDNISEISLPSDERRAFNRDSRNWKDLSKKKQNYEVFVSALERQTQIIDKYRHGIPLLIEDMHDMGSNGGNPDYLNYWNSMQDNFGSTALGMANLDFSKYIMGPWNYSTDCSRYFRQSLPLYKKLQTQTGKKVPFLVLTGSGDISANAATYTGVKLDEIRQILKENLDGIAALIKDIGVQPIGYLGNLYIPEKLYEWFYSVDMKDSEPVFLERLDMLRNFSDYAWGHEPKSGYKFGQDITHQMGVCGMNAGQVTINMNNDPFNCGEIGNICYSKAGEDVKCENGVCKCRRCDLTNSCLDKPSYSTAITWYNCPK